MSYPSWTLLWGTLRFYPAHSMTPLTLECILITQVITFLTNTSLATVCISLLDLVVTLAKSHLVIVFSVEDTPIWGCSVSRQPFLRAFSRHSFMMPFLFQSRPICTLVRLENPFLTHANASLIAPQQSYAYLPSLLTQSPIVYTPVTCSNPCLFNPHADSHHSYRYPLASILIAYVSLQSCGSILYK